MTSSVTLRSMERSDWPAVRRIYQEGIDTGHATFEAEAPGWEQFNTSRLPLHRLVAEDEDGSILGWAAVSMSTERDGIWTIQASVFPENKASLKLHLANGYVVVGRRQRIARMPHGPLTGQWRDTVLIERRSPII